MYMYMYVHTKQTTALNTANTALFCKNQLAHAMTYELLQSIASTDLHVGVSSQLTVDVIHTYTLILKLISLRSMCALLHYNEFTDKQQKKQTETKGKAFP